MEGVAQGGDCGQVSVVSFFGVYHVCLFVYMYDFCVFTCVCVLFVCMCMYVIIWVCMGVVCGGGVGEGVLGVGV